MQKRIFIAVNIPTSCKEAIAKKILPILPQKGLKIVAPENLHITLAFLGYLNEQKIIEVEEKLAKINFNSFNFNLENFGQFNYRVLWIGISQGKENFIALAKTVNELLCLKDEKFSPHLTIARNKTLTKEHIEKILEKLKKIKFSENLKAESIDIMESKLSSDGPTYLLLKKIELKR